MTTDIAVQEQRDLAVANREEAAGAPVRAPFPVTLVCQGCGHLFVAVLWYASQPKLYCSDLCRDGSRDDQRRPLADRFWEKVNRDGPLSEHRPDLGPCWLWTGAKDSNGYGLIQTGRYSTAGNRVPEYAHRVSVRLTGEAIPEGLVLDHLCRTTCCVRPSHLEAVTERENILRGEGMSARHARATHCQRGHRKAAANTYRYPDGTTECIACRRARATG